MTKRATLPASSWRSAFSLMEMSIVLLIMSAVIGAGFTMTNKQNQLEKIKITNANLDKIEAALMSFRTMNNRLPCPADASMTPSNANYGVEAASGTSGAVVNCVGGTPASNFSGALNNNVEGTPGTGIVGGMVPLVALGLNESDVLDGWGNKITYHVDSKATLTGAFTTYPVSSDKCFDITIDDNTASTSGGDHNFHMLHGVYTLVSHGVDGHGAFSVAGTRLNTASPNAGTYSIYQNANADFNASGAATTYDNMFYDVPAGENATNSKDRYDDYVRYKSRSQLRTEQDGPGTFFPDLMVASNTGGLGQYQLHYYYRCNKQFRKEVKWLSAGSWTLGNFGVDVSPNNKRILTGVYGSPLFKVWNYDGTNSYPLTTGYFSSVPTAPGGTATGHAVNWLSDNAFIVSSENTDPAYVGGGKRNKLLVYEEDDNNPNNFTLVQDPFPAGSTADLPMVTTTYANISPDKSEALLLRYAAAATPTLWSRNSNNTFTWVQNALNPAPAAGTTVTGIFARWSDNMMYLAFASNNDADKIQIFRNDGNHTYNEVAAPSPAPTYNVGGIAFSPDARFLVTIGSTTTSWNIYERTTGDSFTAIASPPAALPANPGQVRFSSDGRFLAVTQPAAATSLLIYERTGSTFTLLSSPDGPNAYPSIPVGLIWRNPMNWERRELQ